MVSLTELLKKSKEEQAKKQAEKVKVEETVVKPIKSSSAPKKLVKATKDKAKEEEFQDDEIENKPLDVNTLLGRTNEIGEEEPAKKKSKQWTIHKLVGEVIGDTIVKNRTGKYQGQHYYDLQVDIKGRPEIKIISAMRSKINDDQIWDDIVNTNYGHKKLTFFCTVRGDKYRLRKWKENKVK